MRLVTFLRDDAMRLGAMAGDHVVDLAEASKATGNPPLATDMIALLETGAEGLRVAEAALRAAEQAPSDAFVYPVREVELQAPVPCPRKLLLLAGNYSSHLEEEGRAAREKAEQTPRVFMKPPSTTVNRPGGDIVLSPYAQWVDWEVELACVVGRAAKYVSAEEAQRHIAGYTIVNDVSEREFKVADRTKTEDFDRFFDWLNGKWPDGFAPMGPCLVTPDELPEDLDLGISLTVNGETMQDGRTSQLTYTCPEIIAYISRWVTLEPGDVIATGTPAGIGKVRGLRLHPGDVVRCTIEGIGTLENRVVREKT
ncbi:MAG: fumarylacetoacetate hydrolase family protein [Planctomycetota bacterium]